MQLDIRIVSMHGGANNATGIQSYPDGTTVNGLIAILKLSDEFTYAVLVNDMPAAVESRDQIILNDGDKVTIFPPIQGGKRPR